MVYFLLSFILRPYPPYLNLLIFFVLKLLKKTKKKKKFKKCLNFKIATKEVFYLEYFLQ